VLGSGCLRLEVEGGSSGGKVGSKSSESESEDADGRLVCSRTGHRLFWAAADLSSAIMSRRPNALIGESSMIFKV
jgi:hypothetical protein